MAPFTIESEIKHSTFYLIKFPVKTFTYRDLKVKNYKIMKSLHLNIVNNEVIMMLLLLLFLHFIKWYIEYIKLHDI